MCFRFFCLYRWLLCWWVTVQPMGKHLKKRTKTHSETTSKAQTQVVAVVDPSRAGKSMMTLVCETERVGGIFGQEMPNRPR